MASVVTTRPEMKPVRPRLRITAKGQVTLRQEVLRHLGAGPGDDIEVDMLPEGRVVIQAARSAVSWDEVFGRLHRYSRRPVSVEEMNEAIARGYAGENG